MLSSALWVYDLLLTIADEIELIWFARWNLLKVLYLFQRYMPLVDTVTLVLYGACLFIFTLCCLLTCPPATFSSTPSVKLCASLFKTSGCTFHLCSTIHFASLMTAGYPQGCSWSASPSPKVSTKSLLYLTSNMTNPKYTLVVLTIRALAAFGNTKWRSIFTAIFFLACWVPNFYFLRRFQMSVTCTWSPLFLSSPHTM